MDRNFDDYPGFQPFRSWANTYAQDCITDKKESRFEVPNAKPLLGDIDIHFVHFKSQYVSTLTRFLFIRTPVKLL